MEKPKFKIEDEVVFKGTRNKKRRIWFSKEQKLESVAPAQVFRVTDVIIENCYGGTQIHYNLRPMSYGEDDSISDTTSLCGVMKDLIKAREIELEAK